MRFSELSRTWIVAEIGVNHEGDVGVAKELIRKAADCGADAVKFQTFKAEHYVSAVQPERRERAGRFALPYAAFAELAAVAREAGVTFFSTPLHDDDVDALESLVPLYKISSGDLTHLRLIKYAAAKGKPMVVSTGLGTEAETRAAVDAILAVRPDIRERGELMLMHCVAAYPTPAEEANLRNIGWLRDTFGVPVGYSDHTLGIEACQLAIAAGAVAVEKHFTYRKEDQAFHDHLLSADPADMRQLVESIRRVETYLGQRARERGPSESKLLQHMRRSVGAAVDIPAGQPVKAEWLTFLRPAWGLPPERFDDVVGRTLTRAIPKGDLVKEEDLTV